jgi:hypothetical protein
LKGKGLNMNTNEVIYDYVRDRKVCLHTNRLLNASILDVLEEVVVYIIAAAAIMILLQALRGWI